MEKEARFFYYDKIRHNWLSFALRIPWPKNATNHRQLCWQALRELGREREIPQSLVKWLNDEGIDALLFTLESLNERESRERFLIEPFLDERSDTFWLETDTGSLYRYFDRTREGVMLIDCDGNIPMWMDHETFERCFIEYDENRRKM